MSQFFPEDGDVDYASPVSSSEPPSEENGEGGAVSRSAEYLLVETIRRVGVSNYSLIARLTGLNSETVRYKVNRQLARMGLGIKVNLDYSNLGFSMGFLDVRARYHPNRSWVDYCSYVTFVGKVMGSDRYLCLYALPHRFKKKYVDELAGLQTSGLIDHFDSSDVAWARNPPFRSELFDFERSQWNIDWGRLDGVQKETGLTTIFPCRDDAKVDSIDVKIILSLQEDPTVNPAKIAKQLGANPRTIRYHYLEHVVKGKLILGNNVRWASPLLEEQQGNLMKVALSFRELLPEESTQVQKICNRIPFTWLELKLANGGYVALLEIPVRHFQETVQYVETRIEALQKKSEFIILDSMKTQMLNIPYEMFDHERGWRLMPFQRKPGSEQAASQENGAEAMEEEEEEAVVPQASVPSPLSGQHAPKKEKGDEEQVAGSLVVSHK